MTAAELVPLIIAIPLGTAALLAATGSFLRRRVIDSVAGLAALLTSTCATLVFLHSVHQPIVYWFGGWYPRNGVALGVAFYADPIASILAALTGFLTLMGFVFSWKYFESAGSLFHALMLSLCGAICGFLLTADLFNLFVFLELSTVAGVALSGYHSDSPGPLQGAWNFGIIATMGAALGLTGIALIYGRTGALNYAQAGASISGHPDPLVIVAFAFIACGVLVKAGIAPFHFWLSDAHAVAATPACVMFSGIMVEMSVVVVLRLYFVLFSTALGNQESAIRGVLAAFGTVTAVLGAVMCLLQLHLKRMLAYSTISHVGLVLLAGSLFVPEAIAGAMLYIVAHGLVKGALFLSTGLMKQRFDAIDEGELHGRARGWYSLLVIYVLAATGLAGAPLFATGMADSLIHSSATGHGFKWIPWVFAFAGVITTAAVLRSSGAVFFGIGPAGRKKSRSGDGGEREAESNGRKVERVMLLPAVILIAAGICFTFTAGAARVAQSAATDFQDGTRIRDRILRATATLLKPADPALERHEREEPVLKKFNVVPGSLHVLFALLVAAIALMRTRLGLTRNSVLRAPVRLLHTIHSGAVGDYAAWFAAGVAVFAGTLLYLFAG